MLFGVGPIDIGLPLRPIQGRDLPVVASEDIQARDELTALLDKLGLIVERVDVDPRLPWQPKAPDLVAVCGPKSSPTIEEILENDPVLSFKPDDKGRWGTTDRVTGQLFVSPMDELTPMNADVAYVGWVRFDDDRSLFLVAGVHAIGSLGAVHYLKAHLDDIYKQIRTRNFSMVIASENNGHGEIKTSEAACLALPH